MQAYSTHLAATLFFMAGMVLLSIFRERLRAENAESFRNMAAGITVLALAALGQLAAATGALTLVPFLSAEPFFQLVSVIAAITGMILLLSGISVWLPLDRTLRLYNRIRVRRLDLLRRVEQLVGIESRLTSILEKSLRHMLAQFDLQGGAVFVRGRRSNRLHLLASYTDDDSFAAGIALTTASVRDRVHDACEDRTADAIIATAPAGTPAPTLVLPVEVHGRVAASFVLWPGELEPLSDDDRVLLKLTCERLARRMEIEALELDRSHRRALGHTVQELRDAIAGEEPLGEKLAPAVKILREILPMDLFALTVECGDNDIRRFTVGTEGMLLTEKGLSRDAIENADGVAVRSISLDEIDPMFRRVGINSMLVLRLCFGGRPAAQVMIGGNGESDFGSREIDVLKSLSDLFENLIGQEISHCTIDQSRRRLETFNQFMVECSGYHREIEHVYARAADLLRSELRVAAVRVSTFEDDGTFIRSRALAAAHPVQQAVPADGYMILSLMPLHTRVKESGDSLLIDDRPETPAISRAEAQQVYQADLQSSLLTPITVAGEVRGVIALAERRPQSRYRITDSARRLAELVASALSLAIRLHETPWDVVAPVGPEALDHSTGVNNRIRSSLTGILGSVEILRSRGGKTDEIDRYIGILDRSARRLEACLTSPVDEHGDTVVAVDSSMTKQ